jgi:murein L,D-transpeptidase YcbB/YkuD
VRQDGGDDFLPVTSVDWGDVTPATFHYLLRQRPGPLNALGKVKLMLPNPYAVYLHDTPTRDLFLRQERSFSSGCVRLSRALELASWVLANDGQVETARRLPDIADSGATVTLHLASPLPTFLVYFTAFTDAAGEVVFRRDIYQRDAALIAALRKGSRS